MSFIGKDNHITNQVQYKIHFTNVKEFMEFKPVLEKSNIMSFADFLPAHSKLQDSYKEDGSRYTIKAIFINYNEINIEYVE